MNTCACEPHACGSKPKIGVYNIVYATKRLNFIDCAKLRELRGIGGAGCVVYSGVRNPDTGEIYPEIHDEMKEEIAVFTADLRQNIPTELWTPRYVCISRSPPVRRHTRAKTTLNTRGESIVVL